MATSVTNNTPPHPAITSTKTQTNTSKSLFSFLGQKQETGEAHKKTAIEERARTAANKGGKTKQN